MVNQFAGSTTCRRNSPAATAWPSAMPSARRWPWRWSTARCAPQELSARTPTSPAQDEEFVLAIPTMSRRRLRAAPQAAALRRFPVRAGDGAGAARGGRAAQPAAPRSTRRRNEPCRTNRQTRLQLRLSRRADQADDPPRHPEGGGDAGLPGAVRRPRDAAALRLGHRRHPGDGRHHRPGRHAEGDRPGRRRHDQRRLDPPLLRQGGRRRHDDAAPRRRPSSRPATACRRRRCSEGQILVFQVPIPEPLRMLEPRETETRTLHALSEYGVMQVQPLRRASPATAASPRPTTIR